MPVSLDDLIRSRRSIRRFLPDPVEREKILACVEAARLAPSAENAQPARFLVVDDPALRTKLAGEAFSGIYGMTKFAAQAPVIVIVLAVRDTLLHRLGGSLQGTPFYLLDVGIAGEHFVLKAEEQGLATCWVGWFDARRARKVLRIPRKYRIAALFPVGYAASRPPSPTKRKALDEVAWFNEAR